MPPLFCVHAEAGDVSLYYGIVRHLDTDQAVLGLCAPSPEEPYATLESLAARHVRDIRQAQGAGPYLILGECTGGALAYEIAQQLRSAGEEVRLLALVDSFAPGLPRISPLTPRPLHRIVHRVRILAFHFGNVIRLGGRERLAYVTSRLTRVRAALTVKASAISGRPVADASGRLSFRGALAAYEPRPYAGSLLVLRASRLPLGSLAPRDLGWGALSAHAEVEVLPGYFTTPISEPLVRTLAERLAVHLTAAVADPGARA
jgi:thioesterase domain-containing protein